MCVPVLSVIVAFVSVPVRCVCLLSGLSHFVPHLVLMVVLCMLLDYVWSCGGVKKCCVNLGWSQRACSVSALDAWASV